MSAAILGIGTAVPAGSICQSEAMELARAIGGDDDRSGRRLAVLYRQTSVIRRGTVLVGTSNGRSSPGVFYPPAMSAEDRGPPTSERLIRYATEAPALAERASLEALADAGVTRESITHLVTVSCTGFSAPGLDVRLIRALGLSPRTERTHIGFMGCHGAINGLRVAGALVNANPSARVLLCAVELCSLHFQYGSSGGQAVANALFADGAGAAVVGESEDRASALRGFGSCIIPDSADAMTWTIGDHGFEMTLSAGVPDLLRRHLRAWVEDWLMGHGLSANRVCSWAVHPGGPRVLDVVAQTLGLDAEAMAPSREVLATRGNMSSPTVLFILDALRRSGARRPCVALAFGPGMAAEGAIIG